MFANVLANNVETTDMLQHEKILCLLLLDIECPCCNHKTGNCSRFRVRSEDVPTFRRADLRLALAPWAQKYNFYPHPYPTLQGYFFFTVSKVVLLKTAVVTLLFAKPKKPWLISEETLRYLDYTWQHIVTDCALVASSQS